MPDEITIKPKSESTPGTTPENQTVSSGRAQLVSLCALGLGVSFFLPRAQFFGATSSGFDLQKFGDEQRLLWLIPVFSTITLIAGLAKQSLQLVARITGVLPFCALGYYFNKIGSDVMHILAIGAYLSFIFGIALIILPKKSK